MQVQPASLAQVLHGRDGRFVEVDDDVAGFASRLLELDHRLRLRFSEAGGYFVVYRIIEQADGSTKKDLVTTATELDARLLQRVERVYGRGYDYGAEMARADVEAELAANRAADEHFGEMAEQLAHAFRKDLGVKPQRVYVPRDV